ncbi:unnamed protein product [Dovyalis caffra]|uniref:C2 domain-containing protein n=1 Tax=Dovyalis caffra TaxID=77055 RepID=A0AAV1SBH9_9ROSI|nr:unnamed protein product [Dovyalis caffra]
MLVSLFDNKTSGLSLLFGSHEVDMLTSLSLQTFLSRRFTCSYKELANYVLIHCPTTSLIRIKAFMSICGIQALPLEVTVVACYNLEDKEWISRQDPYVSVEYGNTKYRTKTCTDGGRNPTFQEKFIFTLIEGLRELNVVVWNSHTLSADEHIGTGRIQLHKALSGGFDDVSWPIQSKTGRHSGEVRLILHYSNAEQHKAKMTPSGPKYATPSATLNQVLPYSSMSTAPATHYPATAAYSAASPYTGYPPNPVTYPLSLYLPTPPAGYPPQACAPAGYPPQAYPPPHQPLPCYPTGAISGVYPPPPSGIYPPPPY